MINIDTEKALSLREATALLPGRRTGRRLHHATLHRWATEGLRGVRLETFQLGGTRCTSIEALQRFFDRLSVEDSEEIASEPTSHSGGHATLTSTGRERPGGSE